MSRKFLQVLKAISRACQGKSITEAEVEKIFQDNGFFVELGYQGFGKDLLAQRGKRRKRFDVALTGFGAGYMPSLNSKNHPKKILNPSGVNSWRNTSIRT